MKRPNKKTQLMAASNCGSCGLEYIRSELTQVKVASWNLFICVSCRSEDPTESFVKAASILKRGQSDPQLDGPDVIIEPSESLIREAVNRIKMEKPNFFKGVRKIVSGPSSAYGHVESGPGKDPHVINVNFPRIKAEVQAKLSGASQEQIKEEIIRQLVHVIGHEDVHITGPKGPDDIFANESVADKAADELSALVGKKPNGV